MKDEIISNRYDYNEKEYEVRVFLLLTGILRLSHRDND